MSARRPWAWPLVPLYAAALSAKNTLRKLGWSRQVKLQWPVVSVGSLSAGGAGKTPVVMALATLLRARGQHVDILSRGYGRDASHKHLPAQVMPQMEDAASRFGDEPTLIAQRTGAPVWVGRDRFSAGTTAENFAKEPPFRFERPMLGPPLATHGIHLLDDGFQHRQLSRTVDIALVTEADLDDALLPAGNRREPLSSLQRADVIVIREEERETIEPRVAPLMRPGTLLWSIHRRLRFPAPLGVLSAGLRPVAFCAIARPEGFAEMLLDAGCGIVETVAFRDHHAFSLSDIDQVLLVAERLGATGFVTTEKDAVKLSPALRDQLELVGPLVIVALEAEFVYPERVARELEARLA
jgi:tetraacyldisaccharide 4'-kinase